MMIVDNEFNIGDEVYLKTDADQLMRIVTGLHIHAGSIGYNLGCGMYESSHYDFEITAVKDVLKSTSN